MYIIISICASQGDWDKETTRQFKDSLNELV